MDKLETIQSAVQDLKESFDKEKTTSPPILFLELEEQTSFRLFGPTEKNKQLTLKKLANELANPSLARIIEVVLLASNKLELVKTQIFQLKVSYESQQQVFASPDSYIKTLKEGEGSNMPRSSNQDAGEILSKLLGKNGVMLNMDQAKRFLLILLT
jgi:hypothetical protein